jgi:hypothetical protein
MRTGNRQPLLIPMLRIDRDIQLPEKYKENFDVSSEGAWGNAFATN